MFDKQHTLAGTFSLSGSGLHTGAETTLTVKPAGEGHGFVFRRVDLPGMPEIPANLDHVADTQRSTTIAAGDAKVQTIEHLLSALTALGVDNALIEINGPEMPILDGSAGPYVEAIHEVGLLEQKAPREYLVIDEPIHYHDAENNIDLAALQYDGFRATVMVDYNSKVLGIQHATLASLADYVEGFAHSRTFCFFHELEPLLNAGLIKGGTLDNAIVIVDNPVQEPEMEKLRALFGRTDIQVAKEGILSNVALRYPNEPARHKLMDLIGDLALLGRPLKAQIIAAKPGHAANVNFARHIKMQLRQRRIIHRYQQQAQPTQAVVFDINAIQRILPHRYPFLLVDRIVSFDETQITGIKNVTVNEPFFDGHFPGNPVMPGVLQIEAMAQVGGILLLNILEKPEEYWAYLVSVDKARFKKPVVPGDQLVLKMEFVSLKRGICKMIGKAFVDGTVVSEAELISSLVKKQHA
jgi:UDP-3-O-[3-hydroxymyristoyl] N-acetylglucosamine deacetylase/3-hydroxyacyl-[acyl-carrier-protein] dehydratase